MATELAVPPWDTLTGPQRDRWSTVLARHGRALQPDEPLAETPLRLAARRTGWHVDRYDDPPHRFLAVATRR